MIDQDLIYSKILFQANVFNADDPMMLGRIRASAQTDNVQAIYEAIPDWSEENDPWGPRDPFLYLPFLPYFFNQTPKDGELVQTLYQNPRIQYSNQFYIQGPFSHPLLSSRQDNQGSNQMLGTGIQYLPFPTIKNNDGTLKDERSYGIFPEPGDNALLGRGNADVVVRENQVLIRAGKTFSRNPKETPIAFNKRGFFQLSQYTQTKKQNGYKKYYKLNEIILPVKYLIEYTLYNPENSVIPDPIFTGEINVYTFPDNSVLTNDEFSLSKKYNGVLKEVIPIQNPALPGTGIPMAEVVKLINGVLESYNNNNDTPFFFRPGLTISNFLNNDSGSSIEKTNVSLLNTQVKPDPAANITGSGLVFFKNAYGQQSSPEKVVEPLIEWVPTPEAVAAIGADYLYLLSHQSQIPGKQVINLDGTIYGILQDQFSDELINQTSSTVRGEELLKLLSLIVKFLIGHSHPYHQIPPSQVAYNGTSVSEILQEIQQGTQKILNTRIRIN